MSKKTGSSKKPDKAKSAENSAAEDAGVLELERKYVFADETVALLTFPEAENIRDCYRAGFEALVDDIERFPDLSVMFGHAVRRSVDRKDYRRRVYLADAKFKLVDNDWEMRLETGNRRLMIKQGKPANDNDPTLNRLETKIGMRVPKIGKIGDVAANSEKSKDVPSALRALFGKKADNEKLYPVVPTESWRNKFLYYKSVTYNDQQFLVAFELAQDEGGAKPIGGKPYALDQFELEVKDVIDVRSEASVMADPGVAGLSVEAVNKEIIEPAFEEEDAYLCDRLGLAHVLESKPQRGFAQAREYMKSAEGMEAAEAARQTHLTTSSYETALESMAQPVG